MVSLRSVYVKKGKQQKSVVFSSIFLLQLPQFDIFQKLAVGRMNRNQKSFVAVKYTQFKKILFKKS